MTDPTALIAARRTTAEHTKERTLKALAAMIRRREHVTFAAVAAQAGVSREYLYRTPELASKIKADRDRTRPRAVHDKEIGDQSIVSALREHVRRLEVQHDEAVRRLREENTDLRRQLENALGQLIER